MALAVDGAIFTWGSGYGLGRFPLRLDLEPSVFCTRIYCMNPRRVLPMSKAWVRLFVLRCSPPELHCRVRTNVRIVHQDRALVRAPLPPGTSLTGRRRRSCVAYCQWRPPLRSCGLQAHTSLRTGLLSRAVCTP